MTFDYDLAGNRTKVTWPSDGNWIYSNFDNHNRVTKVCENGTSGCPSGLLITYTLDPLSRRDAIARPNSTSSDFDYDLASRLTLLSQNVSGTTNDLSRTFTYNPAGQLATRVNATAAHWLAASPGSSAYVANGRNQYTSVAGATHTHDLNGNLTGDGSRTFGYDAENRLTSVSGSASLTLSYDPLGRLRQTTAGAATTDFLYEGDRLIAEYNGATVLRRYAHGPGVDEPIVWYEGANLTTKRWLHPDERGSMVAWTDSGGAATVYRYGAYGEPAGNDFSGSRFRYTGQIALPEVKLYHYKARVYDPALGRFLQTDPVGYDDDFNLYAYVYNDPFSDTDPTGTRRECVATTGTRILSCSEVSDAPSFLAALLDRTKQLGAAIANNTKGRVGAGLGLGASGNLGPVKASGYLFQVTPYGVSGNLSGTEKYEYSSYAGPRLEADFGKTVRVGAAFKQAESRFGGTEGAGRDFVKKGFFGIAGLKAAAPMGNKELRIPNSNGSIGAAAKLGVLDISITIDVLGIYDQYTSE